MQLPQLPACHVYGASERDYRVLIVEDAISGVQAHHLEEAARMGVLHATTGETAKRIDTLAVAGRR